MRGREQDDICVPTTILIKLKKDSQFTQSFFIKIFLKENG